ncbi:hypothetical protein, partial [Acinetobacter baumannii]|uniref:hypothetical protein n=1 Tax=Acinetobacter baumannii TaxID=470 RepID=UPI003393D02E
MRRIEVLKERPKVVANEAEIYHIKSLEETRYEWTDKPLFAPKSQSEPQSYLINNPFDTRKQNKDKSS